MSTFCQRSYHRKYQRREVGGQKKPKPCHCSLWTAPNGMIKIFLDKCKSSPQIKQTNSRLKFFLHFKNYLHLIAFSMGGSRVWNKLTATFINFWKCLKNYSWKISKKGVHTFTQRYLWMSLASRKMEIITHRTFSRPED